MAEHRLHYEYKLVSTTTCLLLPLGVVQSLANHEPDVDVVYRAAFSSLEEGGLPFDFVGGGAGMSAQGERRDGSLKIMPEFAFATYNAQVTAPRTQEETAL